MIYQRYSRRELESERDMADSSIFSINIGGVTVTKINPKTGLAENQDNFNSCIHRSAEEISTPRKTCCNIVIDKGYRCFSLNIYPLTPSSCIGCKNYSPKN